MSSHFKTLFDLHNGSRYMVPRDLCIADIKPKRVLLVGSCLAETWQSQIDCPCDFVLTNGLNELPDSPPHPIEDYDLQLVQIPLRFVMPDDILWHQSFLDTAAYEKAFSETLERLDQYLALALSWNKKHNILTFVANFLVPQRNPMGWFAPRYDLRNPVYFVEQLNFHLCKTIGAFENVFLLDIDAIASVFGRKNIQDDAVEILAHGALLGNSGYEKDQERIGPVASMTDHYGLYRDGYIAAVWHSSGRHV